MQLNNRRAPTAEVSAGQMKFRRGRMFGQQRVNRAPQISDAFAVNDPHAQNPARLALRKVVRHQILHIGGPKRMQIQHAVNRQLDWPIVLVHGDSLIKPNAACHGEVGDADNTDFLFPNPRFHL